MELLRRVHLVLRDDHYCYFVGKQLDRVAHVLHSDGQWIAITGLLVAPATWLLRPYGRYRHGSEA
jgi:hypothetical protein